MVVGYIISGCDSEHVSRYHYGTKAQYAEDDEYHIHES
jgi:hypothetical protein